RVFSYFCFLNLPPQPKSTLFPYTTLFRSVGFKDGEKFIDDVSTQVIQKPVIDELFDMDVEIIKHNQQNYCLYYQDRKQFFNHKVDRKSTRLNSSHVSISYAVFCLKKKIKQ